MNKIEIAYKKNDKWNREVKSLDEVTREEIVSTHEFHKRSIDRYEQWLELNQCQPEDLSSAKRRYAAFRNEFGVTENEIREYYNKRREAEDARRAALGMV